METTQEHAEHRLLKDFSISPDHEKERNTEAFNKAKKRLIADGHHECAVCHTKENLQLHHYGCEWHWENICDFDKLKAFLLINDVYGYSRLLKNLPITTVDDIRNLQWLCQAHHTGVDHEDGGGGTGVHQISGPTFNIQLVCLDGANPLPQKGETFEEAMARIKKFERKVS